jgi:tricarballylate dehydrogenase
VAQQPQQRAYSIIDAKAIGRFMPPVFPGERAVTLGALARQLQLDEGALQRTVAAYNSACRNGTFDHAVLDDCHTEGLEPAKTHWARPIDTPPYSGFALKPGVTFTYLGLKVNTQAAVHFGGRPSANLFAAGEVMAGNVLGQGYTAGVGMTIGTVFGRIAGASAARAARSLEQREAPHDAA